MSLYVAAYDISHPGHREQVADILLTYGRRVQRSVFEIYVEPEEISKLKQQVGAWLEQDDLFDLFPVDRRDPHRRISWQRPPARGQLVVLY
jgi:CRISPR-associated endonuclease Cas2